MSSNSCEMATGLLLDCHCGRCCPSTKGAVGGQTTILLVGGLARLCYIEGNICRLRLWITPVCGRIDPELFPGSIFAAAKAQLLILRGRYAMRTLLTASLLALFCAVLLIAQDSSKRSVEEGRLLALESAWNHAEQSKDAAALNELLGESLVYVDYDGTLRNKQEFLHATLNNNVHQDQFNNHTMPL